MNTLQELFVQEAQELLGAERHVGTLPWAGRQCLISTL